MANTKIPVELSSTPGIIDNSNATAITIDSSENVGIGTSSPTHKLEIRNDVLASTDLDPTAIKLYNNSDGGSAVEFSNSVGAKSKISFGVDSTGAGTDDSYLGFSTALNAGSLTERLRINESGNVGIGDTSPSVKLDVYQSTVGTGAADFRHVNGNRILLNPSYNYYDAYNHIFRGLNGTSTHMTIDNSGDVLVGTTYPYAKFAVRQETIHEITGFFANNTSTNAACVKIVQDGAGSSGPALVVRQDGTGNAITVDSVADGLTVFSVSYNGALSKASGSFKIDHPLEAKTDTHHLVHSFVEAPQADNIYRGKVDLVAGSATANIDTVAGMTEGTFVALNREVQCFTTNESNWDAVKGSVSGNILTIESENSESTATISWLVIGERKDQHMYDTDWTDENGKVIVEPIKS